MLFIFGVLFIQHFMCNWVTYCTEILSVLARQKILQLITRDQLQHKNKTFKLSCQVSLCTKYSDQILQVQRLFCVCPFGFFSPPLVLVFEFVITNRHWKFWFCLWDVLKSIMALGEKKDLYKIQIDGFLLCKMILKRFVWKDFIFYFKVLFTLCDISKSHYLCLSQSPQ